MTQTPSTPQEQPTGPVAGRPGELLDRFLARLIDGLLLGAASWILFGIFSAMLVSQITYDPTTATFVGGSTVLFYIVVGVVFTVLNLGYYAFLESSRGQTVGKMLMKLRTHGPDGVSNPTMAEAVRRNIFMAWPLGFVIPVVGPMIAGLAALIGEVMIAVGINADSVRRQGWHDRLAGGTTVVKVG